MVRDTTMLRRRARIVWESLERAADHLTPGHPTELLIRKALRAAEAYWRALPPPKSGEGEGQAG